MLVQFDWLAETIGEPLEEPMRDDGRFVTSEWEEGHKSADTACEGWLMMCQAIRVKCKIMSVLNLQCTAG